MLIANKPASFPIPFAANAGGSFIRPIPEASQIGVTAGAASLNDGFVPDNFTQIAAGGVPPFGQDMNGILNQTTSWSQWQEAGGPIFYDNTFATGLSGGYPKGALVQSNVVLGNYWMSTADSNTTDPDSLSSANWVPDPGRFKSGDPVASFSSTVPTGFVAANTLTIGNALSNATGRANADTLLAYRAIWNEFNNTACPIFTSAGSASTRGANPDADFAANKALSTPDMRGRGVVGVDTMGGPATTRLNGVPIIIGNATSPGSFLGENLHTLITAELAVHNHGGSTNTMSANDPHTHTTTDLTGTSTNTSAPQSGPTYVVESKFVTPANTSVNHTHQVFSDGSGAAHNNVDQNATVWWNIKL